MRESPIVSVNLYQGNQVEASGDIKRWLLWPMWRLWFGQIIAACQLGKGLHKYMCLIGKSKRLYHSCPFWIKCKWKASTYTLISLSWRKPLKTLQKCETAKPGEFLGVNPPFRTTDSNQVFGVRGPRLWNIRFCSVCSHQERSTWATWLTQGGLPPGLSPMWVFRFRHHAKSNDLPNTSQVDIGGRWTPSIMLRESEGISSRQYFPIL